MAVTIHCPLCGYEHDAISTKDANKKWSRWRKNLITTISSFRNELTKKETKALLSYVEGIWEWK